MKSLQLRRRRQIAEPCKYCLVRVIVFYLTCVFSICFVSHRLGFRLNSLQLGFKVEGGKYNFLERGKYNFSWTYFLKS